MTNEFTPVSCPHCGLDAIKYNEKKHYWRCQNESCDATFEGQRPSSQQNGEQKQLNIFISYGHDDNAPLVHAIKEQLGTRGKVWIDGEQIRRGQDWRNEIALGIKASDHVLSFLSAHSVRDPGVCLDEIGIALSDRHGAIATILVESEKVVKAPASVSHIQYLDLSNWRQYFKAGGSQWADWLAQQCTEIQKKIEGYGNFSGEMEDLSKLLQPIAQHQLLGSIVKQTFVGREWVFEEIENWRKHKLDSKLFLVSSGPGMGKSTIAARLAHFSKLYAAAFHFCRFNDSGSRSAHRFVCNIAYQLAGRSESFRTRLLYKVRTLVAEKPLENFSPNELFSQLINEIGKSTIDGGQCADRFLVVIDALDEAPEVAELLAQRFARVEDQPPDWIAILATTRPEAQILQGLSRQTHRFTIDPTDTRNLQDQNSYIDQWSQGVTGGISQPTKRALLESSEGSIYYLAVAKEGAKNGLFDLNHAESVPLGLSGLYLDWFDRQFAKGDEAWSRAKPLLRLLCASPEPLPLPIATNILGWRNEEDTEVMRPFGALLRRDTGLIQFAHRSFADWLTAPDGKFSVNREEGILQLTDYLWRSRASLINTPTFEYGHRVLPGLLLKLSKCMSTNESKILWDKVAHEFVGFRELDEALRRFQRPDSFFPAQIELAEAELNFCHRIFEPNSAPLLDSKNSLANYIEFTSPKNSLELRREICQVCMTLYGVQNPKTLHAISKLASSLHYFGDYKAVVSLLNTVISERSRVLGEEHSDTLIAKRDLAGALIHIRDYAGAKSLLDDVQALRQKSMEEDHPETITTLQLLNVCLMANPDETNSAKANAAKLLDLQRKKHGSEHPDTLLAMNSLALCMFMRGENQEASNLLEELLGLNIRIFGEDHPRTLTGLQIMGYTQSSLRNYERAVAISKQVFETRCRMLGGEDPETLLAMRVYGVCLVEVGEYKTARIILTQALEICQRVLVEGHQLILETKNALNFPIPLDKEAPKKGYFKKLLGKLMP